MIINKDITSAKSANLDYIKPPQNPHHRILQSAEATGRTRKRWSLGLCRLQRARLMYVFAFAGLKAEKFAVEGGRFSV